MNRKLVPRLGTLLRSVAIRGIVLWILLLAAPLRAEDWPTWRHDAQRTGTGKQQLAAKLYLHWSRDLRPWQRGGHPRTGLKKRCAAVCNWLVAISPDDIRGHAGLVPAASLLAILERIPKAQP